MALGLHRQALGRTLWQMTTSTSSAQCVISCNKCTFDGTSRTGVVLWQNVKGMLIARSKLVLSRLARHGRTK